MLFEKLIINSENIFSLASYFLLNKIYVGCQEVT